jgi:hypothetical protein
LSGFITNFTPHSVGSGVNAITFSPSNVGDQLISIYILSGTSPVPIAPIDSSGDVWTLDVTNNTGAAAQTIAVARLPAASSTASRTLTWATAPAANSHFLFEASGITGLGGTPVFAGVGPGATSLSSGSYTPSQANEFVLAILALQGAANPDHVACTAAAFQAIGNLTDFGSAPCVGIQQNGSSFNSGEASAQIVTSTAAVTAAWTFLANPAFSCIIGFKFTPGGPVTNTKTINEAAAIADIEMKQLSYRRGDSITVADTMTRFAARIRTISESFSVDPDGSSAIANLYQGDPITVIDQLMTLGQIRIRALADAITIIDQLTGTKTGITLRSITESITIADALSTSVLRTPILQDGIGIVDLLTRATIARRNISDSLALIDVNATVGTRNFIKILTESFATQDQLGRVLLKQIAMLEAISVFDLETAVYVPYASTLAALKSPIIIGAE